MRELTYAEAIREAIREEMQRDPHVFFFGEDVGVYGGPLKIYRGLLDEFGPERVIDTPISEAAIVGLGMGAAMMGLKPIADIHRVDFMPIATEIILNHIAQAFFLSGGEMRLSLVISTQYSLGLSIGAQHSQFLPSWFINLPGLYVVLPSTPRDAKGLMKAAIRCEHPVLYIECGRMCRSPIKEEVPDGDYVVPIGVADIKREGRDVTIIAISGTVQEALSAGSELDRNYGIQAEIIDPRSLKPLDANTILSSVRKTGRVIVTSDEYKTGSTTSEIITVICEKLLKDLKSPPVRLTSPDMHIPFPKNLEKEYMVGKEKIITAALKIV